MRKHVFAAILLVLTSLAAFALPPVGADGRYYSDPKVMPAATIQPVLVTASPTAVVFSTEGRHNIIGELRTHELLVTALAGVNNDLTFVAKAPGVLTTHPSIKYTVAGLSTPLSVVVTASLIDVKVATDGAGAAISTSAQVKAAIEANAAASRLVTVAHSGADTGAGAVIAMAETALGAWTGTVTLNVKLQTTVDGTNYTDVGTAFTQKTALGAAQKLLFAPVGTHAKWVVTVGGTSPVLAYSVAAWTRP